MHAQKSQTPALIADAANVLSQFKAELTNKLTLWRHMNEWQLFDQHVMQHNWRESVVHAGARIDDFDEDGAPVVQEQP